MRRRRIITLHWRSASAQRVQGGFRRVLRSHLIFRAWQLAQAWAMRFLALSRRFGQQIAVRHAVEAYLRGKLIPLISAVWGAFEAIKTPLNQRSSGCHSDRMTRKIRKAHVSHHHNASAVRHSLPFTTKMPYRNQWRRRC